MDKIEFEINKLNKKTQEVINKKEVNDIITNLDDHTKEIKQIIYNFAKYIEYCNSVL